MMYLVKETFRDKGSKKVYKKEMIYNTEDEKRAAELQEKGFLGIELIEKTEEIKENDKEMKEENSKKKSGK